MLTVNPKAAKAAMGIPWEAVNRRNNLKFKIFK